jgi:oligopeptide/dipeptide ABC transporter ATP-binding protein
MSSKNNSVLLEIKELKKYFPVRKGILKRTVGYVKAVDGVNLNINRGETLGLVGESGCGKTTCGKTILRLIEPTEGQIFLYSDKFSTSIHDNKRIDITSVSKKLLKNIRREMQIIFQDPYSCLDPRMTIEKIIEEPLLIFGMKDRKKREIRVMELLSDVGLESVYKTRYPHEFSGGQRQRIGIARALALEPELVVADEPVSALDVSVQAQVLNLLRDLQKKFHLTYLFIAHDLSVIKYISNRIAVMYLGKIVEQCETEELFSNPKHPYTEALISAVPVIDPNKQIQRIRLEGDVPSPLNPPSGCNFHTRCRYSRQICKTTLPQSQDFGKKHIVSCHFADSLKLRSFGEE